MDRFAIRSAIRLAIRLAIPLAIRFALATRDRAYTRRTASRRSTAASSVSSRSTCCPLDPLDWNALLRGNAAIRLRPIAYRPSPSKATNVYPLFPLPDYPFPFPFPFPRKARGYADDRSHGATIRVGIFVYAVIYPCVFQRNRSVRSSFSRFATRVISASWRDPGP